MSKKNLVVHGIIMLFIQELAFSYECRSLIPRFPSVHVCAIIASGDHCVIYTGFKASKVVTRSNFAYRGSLGMRLNTTNLCIIIIPGICKGSVFDVLWEVGTDIVSVVECSHTTSC